jgi:carbon-monoxide dehydrogenase iron sulfur subunit
MPIMVSFEEQVCAAGCRAYTEDCNMNVLKSGKIVHNSDLCTACGVCELICSLYHDGIIGPPLARINILRDAFTAQHRHIICQQCHDPGCYNACPLQDQALCIDGATGVIYIDEDECTGCKMCIDACPFDPPGIKFNTEKNVAFKCDLCKGIEGGPMCVEYCPFQALTYITNDGCL